MNVESAYENCKPFTSPANDAQPRHIQVAHDYLVARGISPAAFEQVGNKIVAHANSVDSTYPAVPALVFNFYHPLTGHALTYTDVQGVVRPFQRIRPLGTSGAKFLQPRGSGTHVYFANDPGAAWPTVLADSSYGLVLTEGETRSLAGALRELPVIAITGVDCGQADGDLHPDLACIEWHDRQVFMAFDSDVSHKPGPQAALHKLAALLRQRGAVVYEVSLPHAPDGSKQGLDDYLARHGSEAFTALICSPQTRPYPSLETYDPPVALADLMAVSYPPTEWAWDQFILQSEVNLLYGDGGVGKSLLALYLGVAVAGGRPLFGSATTHMPVLAFFAEDSAAQVKLRVTTILTELGLDHKGKLPIKLWCQPRGETLLARISDNGEITELPRLQALRAELTALGASALLIVDSLADLFAMNESLRPPVNAALKQVLGGLCRDFGATVLVLAHPSKASMTDGTHYSGSTAFNNAVRQRLTLEFDKHERSGFAEGPPPRMLSVAKSNYGAQGEKTLWYYGARIKEVANASTDTFMVAAFHKAIVDAAIVASNNNVPCNRVHVPARIFEEGRKILGRQPSRKEVLSELEKAADLKELIFQKGSSKRAAGFYPPDPERAAAIALAVRKSVKARKRSDGGV